MAILSVRGSITVGLSIGAGLYTAILSPNSLGYFDGELYQGEHRVSSFTGFYMPYSEVLLGQLLQQFHFPGNNCYDEKILEGGGGPAQY